MTRYALSSDDLLILRDGRPFGDTGTFGGTALDWPLPQTLAGMCRSSLGFDRSDDYFSDAGNIKQILSVGLRRVLPGLSGAGSHEHLMPTPADLVLTEKSGGAPGSNTYQLYPLAFRDLADGEGTDLESTLWQYPTLDSGIKDKPAPSPRFIRWALAEAYLRGDIPVKGVSMDLEKQAISGPVREFRIHTAIDPSTRSVDEGRLYAESGIYLKSVSRDQEQPGGMKNRLAEYSSGYQGDLALTFELDGLESGEALNPCLYLGGERRRVDIETPSALPFPACPDFLDNQAFVKLVLITHGDFESWAPSFLVPDGRPEKADWVKEPVSGVTIRLRSAVVKGWDPVSGWDYASRKQKAFRKLVPPGSVYLVELKHPEESGTLARALWGESLCPKNSQAEKDGYGQILIAKNTLK